MSSLYKRKKSGEDGTRFLFSVSTTTDVFLEGPRAVWINVEGGGQKYSLFIIDRDYHENWMSRFVNAFCSNAKFREQFLEWPPEEGLSPHNTIPITLRDQIANIDEDIAPAIVALNERGAITAYCCQGSGRGRTPFITLNGGRFPDELVQAWEGAGFRVTATKVHAYPPANWLSASEEFLQSLSDWLAGCLDTTGRRYRVGGLRNFLPLLPDDASP